MVEEINFLNYRVSNISMDQAISFIDEWVVNKKPKCIVALNASKIVYAEKDAKLKKIIMNADLILPEYAVIWGAKTLGTPLKEHIGGIMLMRRILEETSNKNYKIFFLGANEDILNRMVLNIKNDYPKANIVGAINGYFDAKNSAEIIKEINKSEADILFVALGTPKQEYWIYDNLSLFRTPVCMGVGGSFDVFAGKYKEARPWMRHGLEWLYRLSQSPKYYWKRYLTTHPKYIYRVCKFKVAKKC